MLPIPSRLLAPASPPGTVGDHPRLSQRPGLRCATGSAPSADLPSLVERWEAIMTEMQRSNTQTVRRRRRGLGALVATGALLAGALASGSPAGAVTGGEPDDGRHPQVAFLMVELPD